MIKRLIDLLVSVAALLVLAPVILIVALIVRVMLGPPVLFTQQRPGLHGKLFRLLKFRTMSTAVDAQGKALPDGERLGRFGRLLRRTSIDELPTLWNVVKGDMSLVGPRPLLVEYLEHYSPEQARRHEVRPGITGWAQVNGRNALSWQDKFRLDVWYVDHQSMALDLRILFRTAVKVLSGEGISHPGEATMARFSGND